MLKSTRSTSSVQENVANVTLSEVCDQKQSGKSHTNVKKKSSKTAISVPEHKEFDRPVTRAEPPQEDEISIRIVQDYVNPPTVLEVRINSNYNMQCHSICNPEPSM